MVTLRAAVMMEAAIAAVTGVKVTAALAMKVVGIAAGKAVLARALG